MQHEYKNSDYMVGYKKAFSEMADLWNRNLKLSRDEMLLSLRKYIDKKFNE